MTHKPKYSEQCQRLINACQILESGPNGGVILGQSAFDRYMSSMTPEERDMFYSKDDGILKLISLKP